jgi:Response regulator containing a CheY-like receiver domain and an HTH DNA-binding domain
MKILVVDDHALIREALRGVLQELKPEAGVIDASSCREALQLAQANAGELDLVLFDLGLPDGDGFETRWVSCATSTRLWPSSCCQPPRIATA